MKKEKLVKYVKNRNNSFSNQKIDRFHLIIKDPFEGDLEYQKVFHEASNLIPEHFLDLIDIVYIGQFDFLNNREVNAVYMDGALYITNIQDDHKDLLDDVVHEIAHAVEEKYGNEIYSDGEIEQSFISKRARLKRIIKYQGHSIEGYDFDDISYNKNFDEFLYKEVGYEKLNNLTIGLYLAPYSMTSLREYFARGFEEYYLGNRPYLKKVCPYIYNKLISLEDISEDNYETQY